MEGNGLVSSASEALGELNLDEVLSRCDGPTRDAVRRKLLDKLLLDAVLDAEDPPQSFLPEWLDNPHACRMLGMIMCGVRLRGPCQDEGG